MWSEVTTGAFGAETLHPLHAEDAGRRGRVQQREAGTPVGGGAGDFEAGVDAGVEGHNEQAGFFQSFYARVPCMILCGTWLIFVHWLIVLHLGSQAKGSRSTTSSVPSAPVVAIGVAMVRTGDCR